MRSRLSCSVALLLFAVPAWSADQPQWGQAWSRNMVSEEKELPETWNLETGENVLWSAPLGTQSYATPIVAGGRVYIGTNNEVPRDSQHVGDRGAYYCFDEKDGHLLWQLLVPKRVEDQYYDWPKTGMCSEITVEGDRGYLVDNRGEVVCLDLKGMANGNDGPFQDEGAHLTPFALPSAFTGGAKAPNAPSERPAAEAAGSIDADIVWLFDMPSQAGTWPHDGAHSSILIDGDFLYLNTGTGVDNTHRVIRTPDAPSLIVLDKKTGRLLARDDEHIAPNIFHATWSSPSLVEVKGQRQLVFAGGDGVVRSFEPLKAASPEGEVAKLKKIWQLDFDPQAPKGDIHKYVSNKKEGPSDLYGMPVVVKDRLYLGGGGDMWWGKNQAWLKCIDVTGTGDITENGVVWTAPLEKHVMSTAAIYDGMVFIADMGRKVRCLDAETGKELWTQDMGGDFWSSPLVADGKVYIGSKKGDFLVLAAAREKKILAKTDFKQGISATVTAANGTLYVATMTRLYALKKGAGK